MPEPTMDERERLALLIDPDTAQFQDGRPGRTALEIADRLLASGWHDGTRVPESGSPEEDAMARRAYEAMIARMPIFEPDIALTGWAYQNEVCRDDWRAAIRAALRAETKAP